MAETVSSCIGVDIADVAATLRGNKVLVTGANGFIGGRLVERLLIECGAQPRVLLRNYSRAARIARFGFDRVEVVIGSLADPASLSRAVEGCSVAGRPLPQKSSDFRSCVLHGGAWGGRGERSTPQITFGFCGAPA
jgi:nucleoside-diphosphate-sugar epimerase